MRRDRWVFSLYLLLTMSLGLNDAVCFSAEEKQQSAIIKDSGTQSFSDPLPSRCFHRFGTPRLLGEGEIAFSSDGKKLATDWDDRIHLWDVSTGELITRLGKHKGTAWGMCFSPDCKYLAAGTNNGYLYVWDLVASQELFHLEAHSEGVPCLAFSADGTRIISGSHDNSIAIWDVLNKKRIRHYAGLASEVKSITISDDGKTLVWSGNGLFHSCELMTGNHIRQFPIERESGLHFTKGCCNGSIAAAGSGGTICTWELANGKESLRLTLVTTSISSVDISHDGRWLAFGTRTGDVGLIDINKKKVTHRFQSVPGDAAKVRFSPDDMNLAVWGSNTTYRIHLWNRVTMRERFLFPGHHAEVESLAYSTDGRMLASADTTGALIIWDTTSGKEIRFLPGYGPTVRGGGCIVGESIVTLWDTVARFHPLPLDPVPAQMISCTLSPDRRHLGFSSGPDVIIWTVESAKESWRLRPSSDDLLTSFAFSSNGTTIATVSGRETVVNVWDIGTKRRLLTLGPHEDSIQRVTYSPDGRTIASLSRRGILRFWDSLTGKQLGTIDTGTRIIRSFAFSPNSYMVATIAMNEPLIRLWEVVTRRERFRLSGHPSGFVSSLVFSPDGHSLATGGADTTILVWSLTRAKLKSKAEPSDFHLTGFEKPWTQLSNPDPAIAYNAMCAFVAAPDSAVTFLKERLHPIRPLSASAKRKLALRIHDLESDNFAVREDAMRDIINTGNLARPDLLSCLHSSPPLETRRRIEQLLMQLDTPLVSPERLRVCRAIETLEYIGTSEACRVLDNLAKGVPDHWLSHEAVIAFDRLRSRVRQSPRLK